jgi:putative phosphoesterase
VKLGIISDIHGDAVALRQALALLEAQGINQIVCAGDLVNKGADAADVIQVLTERAIPTVQGNHDTDACADGFILVYKNERDGIEIPFTHELSDDMQQYLSTLPHALSFQWEGKRIHMTHATTWDQITELRAETGAALFERIAADANADVVILGHTHIPMTVRVGNCLLVNPGCVYYGYPEYRSTCAVLTLPECAFRVFDVNSGAETDLLRLTL